MIETLWNCLVRFTEQSPLYLLGAVIVALPLGFFANHPREGEEI